MTVVIAGILAAFAASKISTTSFHTEGFANRVAAMVRYAQKVAVSQRRTVAVVITTGTSGSIALCYTDTSCTGGHVHEPPGSDAFTYSVPNSNVSLGGSSFTFNALGKPSAGGAITVTGDVTRTITVEAETGYVH